MRILMVSPTLLEPPRRVGGGERYVDELARALSQNASVGYVRVLGFNGRRYDVQESPKLSFHSYSTKFHKRNPFNPYLNPLVLKHLDWDLLYLHQFHTWLTPSCIAWAKTLRRKIALTDHNGGGATYNRRLKLDRWIDLMLSTSNLATEDLKLRPRRTETIYGGVNTSKFVPPGREGERENFLFVGRALPIKGLEETLVSASRADTPRKLTLALWAESSTDPYVRHLQNQWSKLERNSRMRVEFVVNADAERVLHAYQAHAWTILPSRNEFPRECLGLTVLEALSCGSNAATSPHAGVAELARAFESPVFQIVKDWTHFFETAEHDSAHPGLARTWAETHASWSQVAHRAVRAFETLAGGSSRA